MQYLKIENTGVADVNCFTLVGASITRYAGSSGTTGQFGSGFKHAVNYFLRQGISPVIFAGNLKLEYYTEGVTLNDGLFEKGLNRVCVQFSGKDNEGRQVKRKESLGWTLEMGELDWNHADMACREFVTNAFDMSYRVAGNYSACSFELVQENQVRAKAGTTRIFLPFNEEVAGFYYSMSKRFLFMFGSVEPGLLSKTVNRHIVHNAGPVIYRKGVYVREMKRAEEKSLFDYNFGDEVNIDECRNLDDYRVVGAAGQLLAKCKPFEKVKILDAFQHHSSAWEMDNIGYYDLHSYVTDEDKKAWVIAWEGYYGTKVMCKSSSERQLLENKGYHAVIVPEGWYRFLSDCGVKNVNVLVSKEELEGKILVVPCDPLVSEVHNIWGFLELKGYTNYREMPRVQVYKDVKKSKDVRGYYRDGTIFLNEDYIGSNDIKKTILEEMVHHITGAEDFTRQFQEFLLQIIVDMM